jgi:hypothetical protein
MRKTLDAQNTERDCEKKVTSAICLVHTRFTPAGFIMWAHLVQFTFGGKRASAGR